MNILRKTFIDLGEESWGLAGGQMYKGQIFQLCIHLMHLEKEP